MTIKLLVSFTAILIAISCNLLKKDESDLKGILLDCNISILDESSGMVLNKTDSVYIYYLDNLIMYREFVHIRKYNEKSIIDGVFVMSDDPETISYEGLKFVNYIHDYKSKIGFKYDSVNIKNYKVFNVDSFAKKKLFLGTKIFSYDSNDVLVDTKRHKNTSIQKYATKVKFDNSYSDTTFLYFDDKLNDIPFTLSQEADSINQSKLVRIRHVYNSSNINNIKIKQREFSFQITKLNIKNKDEILKLFNRYKKDLLLSH
jgi:hypothetical protein